MLGFQSDYLTVYNIAALNQVVNYDKRRVSVFNLVPANSFKYLEKPWVKRIVFSSRYDHDKAS